MVVTMTGALLQTIINLDFLMTFTSCRGTKDFMVEVSDDLKEWRISFKGTLSSAKGKGCKAPVQDVYIGETLRYIRFKATSYYGHGAGLNYLGWAADSQSLAPCLSLQYQYHYSLLSFFRH